jgi:DNA transformation protein and related proteins
MRVKSSLAGYVAEQLASLGKVSSKSIFGGVGVFVDERLLVIVIDEKVYLHTDPSNLDEFVSRGMPQFKPYPNAFDLTTDHHQVPHEIVQDAAQLKSWAQRALDGAVESAKAKQLAGIEGSRHMKQAKKKQRDEGS